MSPKSATSGARQAATRPGGRWRGPPSLTRANPSLSAIAMVAFNLRPGEGAERKKEQPPVMPPKQEGAPGQAAAPHGMMGGGQEKKVVVPEEIKAVWTAVKIEVESKEKKNKKQFTIPLNSEFKVPDT